MDARSVDEDEAQQQVSDLLDHSELTIITRSGRPVKVLVDYDRFRAMQLDLALFDDPARDEILEAHKHVQAGELEQFEDL